MKKRVKQFLSLHKSWLIFLILILGYIAVYYARLCYIKRKRQILGRMVF